VQIGRAKTVTRLVGPNQRPTRFGRKTYSGCAHLSHTAYSRTGRDCHLPPDRGRGQTMPTLAQALHQLWLDRSSIELRRTMEVATELKNPVSSREMATVSADSWQIMEGKK
jgi:hypothetical protein